MTGEPRWLAGVSPMFAKRDRAHRGDMDNSNSIVYVDESGDHSLTSIDPEYPVFVLAFCVFRKDRYASEVVAPLTNFKFRHFGHDQVILHEREIRKRLGDFAVLSNRDHETEFHAELSDLLKAAPFTLIAAVINKAALTSTYSRPDNPYELALLFCLERLQMHLRASPKITHVVVEKRGEKEDRDLELEFRRICDGQNSLKAGTDKLPFSVVFADKKSNSAGLQVSDLVARPIGLRILRPDQPNRAWDILMPKFRSDPWGRIDRWGLKVFP